MKTLWYKNYNSYNLPMTSDGSTVGPYNTPSLGSKVTTRVDVTVAAANGEVGFADTADITVIEPDGGRTQVGGFFHGQVIKIVSFKCLINS